METKDNDHSERRTLVTRSEAAWMLKCSSGTVDNYLRDGKLTKYKRGNGRVFIDPAEVERIIKERDTIVKAG